MDSSIEWLLAELKKNGKSRRWLAEKLFLSPRTIDKWVEKGSFSAGKRARIEKLIKEEQNNETSHNVPTQVVLEFSPEQYAVVKAEAERRGLTVEEWAREVLQSLANVTVRVRA